ncbi:MAG: hypothetical protein OEZ20_09060, partial [candidate division WOR-3 bacterium]|nr:hypothetical protein [candidate division WOR-3 bacterium]
FYSIIVNKDSYFKELSRYIHLNAVRAGLAKKPEQYPWSSYKIYLEKISKDDLVDCENLLDWIGGKDLKERQNAYQEFVNDGIDKKPDLPWVTKNSSHF